MRKIFLCSDLKQSEDKILSIQSSSCVCTNDEHCAVLKKCLLNIEKKSFECDPIGIHVQIFL